MEAGGEGIGEGKGELAGRIAVWMLSPPFLGPPCLPWSPPPGPALPPPPAPTKLRARSAGLLTLLVAGSALALSKAHIIWTFPDHIDSMRGEASPPRPTRLVEKLEFGGAPIASISVASLKR